MIFVVSSIVEIFPLPVDNFLSILDLFSFYLIIR